MNPFMEEGELYADAGDVGGDIQVSESYSRRWVSTNADGTATTVEFHCYTAQEDPETTTNARATPWVQVQAELATWTAYGTDAAEPRNADYRYWDGMGEPGQTPREVCESLNIDDVHAALDQMA